MKFTQRLVSILSVILACVVGGVLWSIPIGKTLALADSKCDVSGALSSDIPVNPMLMPYCTRTEQLANFSWKTFVALNWPSDCQGSPSKDENIGETPQKPRVWEFYNFPSDVFKPNGAKPNPQPVIPPQCPTQNNRIQSVGDVTIFLPGSVPGVFGNNAKSLIGKTTLVDRAGNYTLNEVRMNPVEVKQIVGNNWYSADQLAELNFNNQFDNGGKPFQLICSNKNPDGTYPSESTLKVPCTGDREAGAREGAIEIKASWKVLPPSSISSFSDEYYTTKRTLDVETSVGKEETTVPVALVGFHILEKTSQQGWIWSTFEHRNNVPDNTKIASNADYNFYAQNCTGNCTENTPLATEPYLWRQDFPHAVTKINGIIKPQTPSQITRLVPIPKSVQNLNEKWQKKLPETSVWRNYQLIGVQWLENPYDPYNLAKVGGRSVTPSSLANVTLEPYVQKNEPGRSCIACHTSARLPNKQVKADFSFLMSEAKYKSEQ